MKTTLTLAAVAASILAIGGITLAEDDATEDRQRQRKSGFMLDRVAKTLDLDESQQAAFVTFTEKVRAQFPGRSELRSAESTEERSAAREAWQAEREARDQKMEEILINPEFNVEAFKALRAEGGTLRDDQRAERESRVEEFRAGGEERSDVILAAYAEFHRTLNDQQRQKLVWLSEQRGGSILTGLGGPSAGHPGKGGPDRRGGGGRTFLR
jgi:hypothetical protein